MFRVPEVHSSLTSCHFIYGYLLCMLLFNFANYIILLLCLCILIVVYVLFHCVVLCIVCL